MSLFVPNFFFSVLVENVVKTYNSSSTHCIKQKVTSYIFGKKL